MLKFLRAFFKSWPNNEEFGLIVSLIDFHEAERYSGLASGFLVRKERRAT